MVNFEGHAVAFYTSLAGFYSITTCSLGPGWFKRVVQLHPVVGLSVILGAAGLVMPLTVVPIRRMLKLPTHQFEPHNENAVFPKYADINFDKQ
jgi:hypothetical protein